VNNLNQKNVIAEIYSCNHLGEGVTRIDGKVVFVPGALPDETVVLEITSQQKNFARAALKKVLQTSPHRVTPPCAYFEQCGGCQLQHLIYSAQLSFKTRHLTETLKRIGGLNDVLVKPMRGMLKPLCYRNKCTLHATATPDSITFGYFQPGSHRLLPVTSCLLLPDDFLRLLPALQMILGKIKQKTLISHLILKKSFASGEIMIILVTYQSELLPGNLILQQLTQQFPQVVSLVQNINPHPYHGHLGKKTVVLAGKKFITEHIGPFIFSISPLSFFQINPAQTALLYQQAVAYANLKHHENVLDVYCGTGTLTLFLAQQARWVYGFEMQKEAIHDARQNALINNVQNVSFFAGQAEKQVKQFSKEGKQAEVVVLDPPRQGCHRTVLETIARLSPQRIVYVSCNPGTLARDLKILSGLGYHTVEIQPIDMFPYTAHVECVVLMCASSEAGKC
jgi:23S rRNA (uracil1939-C5)-methyltransferase